MWFVESGVWARRLGFVWMTWCNLPSSITHYKLFQQHFCSHTLHHNEISHPVLMFPFKFCWLNVLCCVVKAFCWNHNFVVLYFFCNVFLLLFIFKNIRWIKSRECIVPLVNKAYFIKVLIKTAVSVWVQWRMGQESWRGSLWSHQPLMLSVTSWQWDLLKALAQEFVPYKVSLKLSD